MSLKAELETWVEALKAYDNQDFEASLDLFQRIGDSSKILTNIGLIYATLGEHELAVENFNAATSLDQFLAVAYFQCGVSNFLMGRFNLSYKDFEEAYLYLRGNESIKYEQLGLKFTLYSAEVLFNRGLSQIYMNRAEEGMTDLRAASKEKVTPEHDVIDDAIRDQGEGYTVFSIPVGVLYRPSENKVKNTKAKDYLGKAKLVAASDPRDAYTTFTGSTRLLQGIGPSGSLIDKPVVDERRPSAALLDRRPTGADLMGTNGLERRGTRNSAPEVSRSGGGSFDSQDSSGGRPQRNLSAGAGAASGGGELGRKQSLAISSLGGGPGATRALSVRRPQQDAAEGLDERPPPPPPAKVNGARLTEIYDDYIGFNNSSTAPTPNFPGANSPDGNRVANWAQKTSQATTGGPPPRRSSPSIMGGASVRRKVTRRATQLTSVSRAYRGGAGSTYEEEEEGYGSGEYDDLPFDLIKIRVKLHYKDDVRGMAIGPELPYDDFLDRVTTKFGKGIGGLELKFKDEDGILVSLKDDSDFELAIETARESAKGKPEGKLEVWCAER